MAGRNLLFTMTEGETGKVLWFKFEPTNNQGMPEAVDVSLWAITLNIVDDTGAAIITNGACVPDADQVANIGEGTFTFDAGQAALMTPGWYRGQFLGIDPDAAEYIFPTTTTVSYFRIKVNEQL